MSNAVNTRLIEEAEFYANYFENTPIATLIRQDIETNNLVSLQSRVKAAANYAYDLEYSPDEVGDIY